MLLCRRQRRLGAESHYLQAPSFPAPQCNWPPSPLPLTRFFARCPQKPDPKWDCPLKPKMSTFSAHWPPAGRPKCTKISQKCPPGPCRTLPPKKGRIFCDFRPLWTSKMELLYQREHVFTFFSILTGTLRSSDRRTQSAFLFKLDSFGYLCGRG